MLKLINLTKEYKSKSGTTTVALREVSYSFPERGLVFIVGKSGSGKSTMLNILGLLDKYNNGDLIINGKSTKDFSQNEMDNWRAQNVGFVFQEFHIIDKYNISQNIALSLEMQGTKPSKQQVASVLKTVDLEGFEKRKSSELSGGQRQRVAIARAIIKNPKVILADEPTGNLDSENSRAIFELLKKLSDQSLVIVISHDEESAKKYADEIVSLEDGRIADIRKGDSHFETVEELVEGTHDAEKVDNLLKSGKKVLLIPKLKNQEQIKEQKLIALDLSESTPKSQPQNKNTLSTKSRLKLALLAMKSKCVRMFFTIILSCIAISFLGFSDIIAQYDTAKLIKSDVDSTSSPFVSVMAQSVSDDEMITSYDKINMLTEAQGKLENKLEANNIEYFKRYNVSAIGLGFDAPLVAFSNRHNRYAKSFFYQHVDSFVEVPSDFDFSRIGVPLSGRLASSTDEIVITNYHLEAYKRFGFKEESGLAHSATRPRYNDAITVETFDDIEGKYISRGHTTEYGLIQRYKIVGMLTFDISQYSEFFDMPNATKLTKEQSDLLLEALTNMNLYFGNLYVNQDFIKNWTALALDYGVNSLRIERDNLEVEMNRCYYFTISDSCFPFRQSDYIPELAVDPTAEINILQELMNTSESHTNKMKYEFDEGGNLTLRQTGHDPYVYFHLADYLTVTKENPLVTVEGNFNGGTVQIFYHTLDFHQAEGERSVLLSEDNNIAELPIEAGQTITTIRIDIDDTQSLEISSIAIDGIEYYLGNDNFPVLAFVEGFNKDSISTAKNKVIVDYNTFQTLLGDQIAGMELPDYSTKDYQKFLNAVVDKGIDLKNFTATFTKKHYDAVLVGSYNFEVVGVYMASASVFAPTSDFGQLYGIISAPDFLLPLTGNQDKIIKLFGEGAKDSLSYIEEAPNVWLDYSGEIRYVLLTTHSEAIFMMDNYFSLFVTIFNIASLIFCVFAILLTYNFISSSIGSRKKDIGILRSLGAKRMDIGWIFIIEVIIVGIFEVLISCILTFIAFRVLNTYLISTIGGLAKTYKLISYGIRQIIIMIALALVAIFVSVSLPIAKIINKQPVDIIKSQE